MIQDETQIYQGDSFYRFDRNFLQCITKQEKNLKKIEKNCKNK